jgi:hypothetical protein
MSFLMRFCWIIWSSKAFTKKRLKRVMHFINIVNCNVFLSAWFHLHRNELFNHNYSLLWKKCERMLIIRCFWKNFFQNKIYFLISSWLFLNIDDWYYKCKNSIKIQILFKMM